MIEIICLDGLKVQKMICFVNNETMSGFEIFHKDMFYKKQNFICQNFQEQIEWLENFKKFDRNNPFQFYQQMEKIGSGGYSDVYKCLDKSDNTLYAMKVIDVQKLDDGQKIVIKNETDIMNILHHPGIARLKEMIETQTQIYMIMELIQSGDLLQYITKKRFLEEIECYKIFKQLVETLIYLQNVSIVHRDIKPENILLIFDEKDRNVTYTKLIDFGFAQYYNIRKNIKNSQTVQEDEEIFGTPNYVAPEVLQGQKATFASDVFSLGVVFYGMLRGKLPFDDNDVEVIYQKTIAGVTKLDDNFWNNISPNAKDLVLKMLDTDPQKRISISDVFKHPWIQNKNDLLQYIGKNRKKT